MSESLQRRFRYSAWANETLAGALAHGEPPEKAVHAYGHVQETEIIWTRRILGRENPNVPLWGKPSLDQAAEWHVEASQAFALILAGLVDGTVGPAFSYKNSKGTAFTNNVEEILEHVLLHSAQYRGESAAFAIAAGMQVPDLDFIAWLREGEPLLMP
jgi:uncharacterized damage-inducible protein DinB